MAGLFEFLGNASQWVKQFGDWKTKRDRINATKKIDKAVDSHNESAVSDIVRNIRNKAEDRSRGA